MKKRILISGIIALIILSLGVGYYIYNNNKIVSTLLLDINPSIEINLNKKEKVVNIVAINDDAKEIIKSKFKGKKLDEAIKGVTNNLIEKGYTKESVVILISTKGDIKEDNVKNLIEKTFENKKVECNIIVQKTDESAKKAAKKYGVSESKASFIKEILETNTDLKFEDLKDKSIDELNTINNKPVEEEPKEENNLDTNDTNNVNSASTNTTRQVYSAPSDPQDKSGAWCTFNKNREAGSTFYYDSMLDSSTSIKFYKDYIGDVSSTQSIGGGTEDIRSSYCIAFVYKIITKDYIYIGKVDSVTGEVIESTRETLPTFITEQEAINIALNYYKITTEDIFDGRIEAVYGLNFYESLNENVYRYQVNMELKDGTRHSIDLKAVDGSILKVNN